MHVFYAPDIESTLQLPQEESHHAVRVLRLDVGASIQIVDGKGGVFVATIAAADAEKCLVNSLQAMPVATNRPYRLHIAIAPTKNMDRLEWFTEKAAEIGIDEISPIYCRFSERKSLKTERLQRILISAMKQSIQPTLTVLNEPCTFKEFVNQVEADVKCIAHCHDDAKTFLAAAVKPGQKVVVMIGPEGDFSEEEVALAKQAGFVAVSLGDSRLRVETAALVACHTVSLVNDLAIQKLSL
jgi:16S rRNA (uracil1498-N3)-methyltransferase